jgi:hypothetical protein
MSKRGEFSVSTRKAGNPRTGSNVMDLDVSAKLGLTSNLERVLAFTVS